LPGKYATVEEACRAAERDANGWIVMTNRAWSTAKDSNYDDPDYVYNALTALGQAAFLNSQGGLRQCWEFYLKTNGPHNYGAHSSEGTLAQFPGEYHVNHEGHRYCIESHIKRGNGSGSDDSGGGHAKARARLPFFQSLCTAAGGEEAAAGAPAELPAPAPAPGAPRSPKKNGAAPKLPPPAPNRAAMQLRRGAVCE
jgi:hypothetical protein